MAGYKEVTTKKERASAPFLIFRCYFTMHNLDHEFKVFIYKTVYSKVLFLALGATIHAKQTAILEFSTFDQTIDMEPFMTFCTKYHFFVRIILQTHKNIFVLNN